MAHLNLVSPNFSDLFKPNLEIGKFPDSDSHIHIPNIADCQGREVKVFHRLYPKQNNAIVELLLIFETLRAHGCRIQAIVPYLPYARQDKKNMNGEVMSALALCNLFARSGCEKLITFDCHFLNEPGETKYGELLIENISMNRELIGHAKEFFAGQPFEVIGPDAGSAYLVEGWGGKYMKKMRGEYTARRKVSYRDVDTLEGDFDVRGKNVLLLDDMISTGSTMIRALEKVRSQGAAKVCCAATHGLFLHNCLEKLRKLADYVFAADTIPTPQSQVSIEPAILEIMNQGTKLF